MSADRNAIFFAASEFAAFESAEIHFAESDPWRTSKKSKVREKGRAERKNRLVVKP